MALITVELTPQVVGLSIFPELGNALKEAICCVAGDIVPKERIEVDLQSSQEPNTVGICASIGLGWRRSLPEEICRDLEFEIKVSLSNCVEKNYPGTDTQIRAIINSR